MIDALYRAAQPRRLYHHVLNGGTLKPHDVAGMVETIEGLEAALTAAQEENERLREAAFALRNAQRAYMEDRGNDEKGRAVGMAAAALDAALNETPNRRNDND